jgi:hypothetical protein
VLPIVTHLTGAAGIEGDSREARVTAQTLLEGTPCLPPPFAQVRSGDSPSALAGEQT